MMKLRLYYSSLFLLIVLLNGGELDGVRLLSPKTVSLMTRNHIEEAVTRTESVVLGVGYSFGLGFRVTDDVARTAQVGSVGGQLGRNGPNHVLD